MNREDAHQLIIGTRVGSIISVDGILLSVEGKFGERYHTGGKQNDYHTFALDGKRELGISTEGPGSDVWAARYFGTFPMSSYQRFKDKIRKTTPDHSLEEGTLERTYSVGTVPWKYSDYVLGKKGGKGVFLAPNDDGKTFDVWMNGEPQEVKDAGYQQRPYGWIKSIDTNEEELVIAPSKSTALNANPLNAQGLCGHPGEVWERVEHLGNLDGTRRNSSLVYRVLEGSSIVERVYGLGSDFFSVSPSGAGEDKPGYWHELVNRSDAPIRLLISWKN